MELTQLEEILSCLKGERTLFRYSRDTYALQLLRDYIGAGMKPAELRQSPYANLLHKPLVKSVLALAGKGALKPQHLDWIEAEQTALNFVLTLDQWGTERNSQRHYRQLSRTGYQLVLQLNFANDHQQQYQQWIKQADCAEFSYWSHPVVKTGRYETLAWVRIDLDFAANQALIEEAQSDWIRRVKSAYLQRYHPQLTEYRERVLKPYAQIWDEAALAAAIRLIRHDLGIKEIFYNSFETGNLMKGISDNLPPRSLYSDLPQKFAFKLTDEIPKFLQDLRHTQQVLRKQKQGARWYKLPNKEFIDVEEKAAA
ncbi:hypothetical protein [uncultured Thiothrix sp.]|uniref:hypothetical protein n=1 Tax=uncultured Thiothrix sp. TaxID=223185 RepID=UPI00262619ED|nr:hypothetical protein [uncultured Thiothrix sp.]